MFRRDSGVTASIEAPFGERRDIVSVVHVTDASQASLTQPLPGPPFRPRVGPSIPMSAFLTGAEDFHRLEDMVRCASL
jgi:hypothetical protein